MFCTINPAWGYFLSELSLNLCIKFGGWGSPFWYLCRPVFRAYWVVDSSEGWQLVGVVAGNIFANSTKVLNSRLSPRLIAEPVHSESGRRYSDTSSSIVSAADVTYPVASPDFTHSLSATCAISSGSMVIGFGPTGIKAFRAVSAGLPGIISQPAGWAI